MVAASDNEVIKRLVVLVADSKSYSRALLRSMLFQLDVKKIHEAVDGIGAIDAIAAVNPDVLILDWDLPVLSAREVIQIARSPGEVPNPLLPIIVISSTGESAEVLEAKKTGVQQFMVRPISLKMLQQRLVKIVVDARRTARVYKQNNQFDGLDLSGLVGEPDDETTETTP